ncbi:hypothetical protein GJ496_003515 [Pomphorhynchus laevis]|nr:hypothetical protein GJ496_003515 [Pomphorhynchus laevis]
MENEFLFDVFVQCLYQQDPSEVKKVNVDKSLSLKSGAEVSNIDENLPQIVYKDQGCISCFVSSHIDPSIIAISNNDEIIELDIAHVYEEYNSKLPNKSGLDVKFDVWSFDRYDNRKVDLADFLLIQSAMLINSSLVNPASLPKSRSRLDRIGMHHNLKGVRTFDSHPYKPQYACGMKDGSAVIHFWGAHDIAYEICSLKLSKRHSPITRIRFDDDGYKLATSEEDGSVRIYQLSKDKATCFYEFSTQLKQTNDILFLHSSTILATAGLSQDKHDVIVWDILQPSYKSRIAAFSAQEGSLALALYENSLISANRRGELAIYDLRNQLRMHSVHAHESPVKAICFSHNGQFVVSGSAEGNIKLWNTLNMKLISTYDRVHTKSALIRGARTGVTQVYLTPQNYLLSSGFDGSLQCRRILIKMDRLLQSFELVGMPRDSGVDIPVADTAEQIYISSLALLKMLKHGRAGVPMEVMGLMLGEFNDEYTISVVDVFAMPQSGTGVSVEAVDPVFQAKMMDMLKRTGRPEMVVGWYHSHPGFGCWLSGVDINTQQSFETLHERAVAVVVDPIQSVKGKVVIDAFRLMNPSALMFRHDVRQVTSLIGHLQKPSMQAIIHGLNRHYYSLGIKYTTTALDHKMLQNLKRDNWSKHLRLKDYSDEEEKNIESLHRIVDLAKKYVKRLEEEATVNNAEELAIRSVGKQDPKRHISEEVDKVLSGNLCQCVGAMICGELFK